MSKAKTQSIIASVEAALEHTTKARVSLLEIGEARHAQDAMACMSIGVAQEKICSVETELSRARRILSGRGKDD